MSRDTKPDGTGTGVEELSDCEREERLLNAMAPLNALVTFKTKPTPFGVLGK